VSEVDLSVAGESDQWMTFMRHTEEGYPLSIFVRMNNPRVQSLVNSGIVSSLSFDIPVEEVRDNGLPVDIGALQALETRFLNEFQLLDVGVFHFASVTGDGGRFAYFVHERPVDFEPTIEHFGVPDVQVGAAIVHDRVALLDLVSPTSAEQQLNGDLQVISSLNQQGDDGTATRTTEFWFYGQTTQIEGLRTELAPLGFAINRWLDEPVGAVFVAETAVDFGTFQQLTPILVDSAEKHGLVYDGWETFVVSQSSPQPAILEANKPKSLLSRIFGAKKN
jgi:hypothetical protein